MYGICHGRQRPNAIWLQTNKSLIIPREDRTATDNLRVLCRIVADRKPNRYELLTKYGLLLNCYPVRELLRVPEQARESVDSQLPPLAHATMGTAKNISLHTVSTLESHSTTVGISCNCKNQCTGHCHCEKNQVQCSIHCHWDEHDCGNLAPVMIRTEMALVDRSQDLDDLGTAAEGPASGQQNTRRTQKRQRESASSITESGWNTRRKRK